MDASIDAWIRQLSAKVGEQFGSAYRGSVLTGSLARGEGVVLRESNGLRLLSDIDLYVVLGASHPPADTPALRRPSTPPWLLGKLDLAVVGRDYFESLGPTLPRAQLCRHHRIFDEAEPHATGVPEPDPNAVVEPDDALKLIFNRCVELLLPSSTTPSLLDDYALWKLRWDAPLGFLAAHGILELDRDAQAGRLAGWCDEKGLRVDRSWLREGLAEWWRVREAARRGPIDPQELSPPGEPFAARAQRAYGWARPFLHATLRRVLSGVNPDPAAVLDRSAHEIADGIGDEWGGRWLRRRGRWGTLREARRWAPLSPPAVRPWWSYGLGGSGPERLFWAVIQLLEGRPPRAAERVLKLGGQDPASAVRSAWSQWILREG